MIPICLPNYSEFIYNYIVYNGFISGKSFTFNNPAKCVNPIILLDNIFLFIIWLLLLIKNSFIIVLGIKSLLVLGINKLYNNANSSDLLNIGVPVDIINYKFILYYISCYNQNNFYFFTYLFYLFYLYIYLVLLILLN